MSRSRYATSRSIASSAGSLSALFEDGREEAVAAVRLWRDAKSRAGVERDAGTRELARGVLLREFRMRGEERVDDGVVLLVEHAARRVDQAPARLHQRRRRGENAGLFRGELGDIGLALPPLEVGVTAQRAEARARRVDQHAVELVGEPLDLGVALAGERLRMHVG